MILSLPALATNLVATSFILFRIWEHRQFVKSDIAEGNATDKVTNILTLLVESSFIYCFVWVIYIMAYFQVFTQTGLLIMDSIMVQIVGIYPTLIILLVAINRSQVDRYTSYASNPTLRFAPNSRTTRNVTSGSIEDGSDITTGLNFRLNASKGASDPSVGGTLVDSKDEKSQSN